MLLFGMKITTFVYLVVFGVTLLIVKSFIRCIICARQHDSSISVNERPPTTLLDSIGENISQEDDTVEIGLEAAVGINFIQRLEITFIKFLKMYYTPGNHEYHCY